MGNARSDRKRDCNRRDFVTAAVAAGALAGMPQASWAGKRPNVLLVIVDQMRRPRWFPASARLPNLDRLSARGVAFDNHFVSAVPCSPSRACLFTGRHMDANGVEVNVTLDGSPSLDPKIPNLGHLFRAAGYQTPYFGKWHLTRQLDRKEDGLEPYGLDWQTRELRTGTADDAKCAQAAISWIKNNGAGPKPWFLTLSMLNPHDICGYRPGLIDRRIPDVFDTLPPNFNDDLSGKPRCQQEYRRVLEHSRSGFRTEKEWLQNLDFYYAMTQRIDRLLGEVMDALAATGRGGDTIVIFTSDHGEMAGSHQLRLKGPFPYVENTNVPLVFSWPGRLPQGVRTPALSQNIDLFPTLASLIGEDVSRFQLPGLDLSPILADPTRPGSEHVLFSFTANISLLAGSRATGGPTITAPQHIRAIRTQESVYARYFDPKLDAREFELYDLKNDPLEMKNLAGDQGRSGFKREMEDRLRVAEGKEMARPRN